MSLSYFSKTPCTDCGMAAGTGEGTGSGEAFGAAKSARIDEDETGAGVKFRFGVEAAATNGEGTSETEFPKLDWAPAPEAATRKPRNSAGMNFIGLSPPRCAEYKSSTMGTTPL